MNSYASVSKIIYFFCVALLSGFAVAQGYQYWPVANDPSMGSFVHVGVKLDVSLSGKSMAFLDDSVKYDDALKAS
jgi:hypothetical protein